MKEKLNALPDSLSAIKRYAAIYLEELPSKEEGGALLIGNDTKVAPLYYKTIVWPPIDPISIARYEQIHEIEIPEKVKEILAIANGIQFLGLRICGISQSMLNDPPLVDRTGNQCLDLSLHCGLPRLRHNNYFSFAYRHWSFSENVDYSISPDNAYVATLKNGKEVGRWHDLKTFISEAVEGAVEYHANTEVVSEKPWWKIW